MDENTASENIEKAGKGIIKWTIYVTVTLSTLGAFFWVLLYSTYFANLSFIIPLRNFYQDAYWKVGAIVLAKKTYPPLDPIYTIQPQKQLVPGLNTYTFIGTFSALEANSTVIVLKSAGGNEYKFSIDSVLLHDQDLWLRIYIIPDIDTLATGLLTSPEVRQPESRPLLSTYSQIKMTGGFPAVVLKTIAVRWNDKRTLSQIESDYSKKPNILLNNSTPESVVLAVFK